VSDILNIVVENLTDRERTLLQFLRLQQQVLDFLQEHPELSGVWPFSQDYSEEHLTQS
jgi:hypothetical protein